MARLTWCESQIARRRTITVLCTKNWIICTSGADNASRKRIHAVPWQYHLRRWIYRSFVVHHFVAMPSLGEGEELTNMNRQCCSVTTWCAVLALTVGLAATASAQVFTGRIDVAVEDST